MGRTGKDSRGRIGIGARIARLFGYLFLFGFIFNAVQLIVLIASEHAGAEPLPLLPNQGAMTGAAAAANLLLAIILFRNSRPRG